MGKKIKKSTKGPASKYISRAKAIRKLQVPLKDFRKLCIIKGIHPREPKKKLGKTHLTYYHLKDINYLEQDKTIDFFRAQNTYRKKLKKAIVKRDLTKVKTLKLEKPVLDINHIVKERYGNFDDAIKDLDDALSLISLVEKFPSHRLFKINPSKIEINQKLILMFKTLIQSQQLLEKVFLSTKGIYFQARIEGYPVIWIEPYPFAQTLPFDVDYKVILSFLEFYQVFLKFVIFKVYKNNNLTFPPKFEQEQEVCQDTSQMTYKNCTVKKSQDQDHIDIIESEELKKIEENKKINKNLFKDLVFFLSREVNRDLFEFVIKSFGGTVYYDIDNFESQTFKENQFTHIVLDRTVQGCLKQNTEYVQPQWIVDCINHQVLLSIQDYIPGKQLPPHLSPFVNQEKEGFVPQRLKEIQLLKGQYEEESIVSSDDEQQEEQEEKKQYKVEKQNSNLKEELKKKQIMNKKNKQEQKQLEGMVLSRKKKKLLDRIRNMTSEKKDQIKQLIKRRKKLEKKQLINK